MIGILDSGVGGLSVYKEIKRLLPNENIIYLADQANFPYGNKSTETLFAIVNNHINFLKNKKAKMIIIACNTATTLTLEKLRNVHDIPFVANSSGRTSCAVIP